MRRRGFIWLLGAAAAWPASAWAQRTRKKAVLGVLVVTGPEPFLGALKEGLRSLKYVEGQDVEFVVRDAQGKTDLLPGLAGELVKRNVDILVAWQTPAAHAAKQATTTIPIVIVAGDPVGTGIVQSLARPGGNITGLSGTTAALGGKTLELIREIMPAAKRIAVLANEPDPFAKPFVDQIQQAGRAMDFEVQPQMIRRPEELESAFAEAQKRRPHAVIVQPSLPRQRSARLALQHRMLAVSPTRAFPEAGGFMSYAPRVLDMYRETATYVDRILKGAKPADLPIQQPTTFEFVLNLTTAKALSITIPRGVLLRADKVIE